jgi:AcrR family transcriptional regulator
VSGAGGPDTGLSTERILAAVRDLIESEGASAFSMRAVGARLGVSPMALYRWYPNKDALLDAVVDSALGDLHLDIPVEGAWTDRAMTAVLQLRRHLLAHRSLLALPGAAGRITGAVLRFADDGLRLAGELGRDTPGTAMVFRSLVWHTFSFVLVVDAWAADGAPDSYREAVHTLSPDEAPLFTGMATEFGSFDADALFEVSTRALIGGLHAGA